MGSNHIRRHFCETIFLNSALCSFFVFLSLLRCFLLFSLFTFSALIFQIYFMFSMQKIRHESKTSPSLAVSVFELITSLSTFPSLAVSVPEPFQTNMTNSCGSWSVAMSRMPVSTIISRCFSKCRIKRFSNSFFDYQKDRTSDIRLHFPTTVSTILLYLGCRLSIWKSSHCYLL